MDVRILICVIFRKESLCKLMQGRCGLFCVVPLPGVGNLGDVDVIKRHSIHYLRA